jgi:hypothetical protein
MLRCVVEDGTRVLRTASRATYFAFFGLKKNQNEQQAGYFTRGK